MVMLKSYGALLKRNPLQQNPREVNPEGFDERSIMKVPTLLYGHLSLGLG